MTTWILKICQIYKMKLGIRERTNHPHPTKKAEKDNGGTKEVTFPIWRIYIGTFRRISFLYLAKSANVCHLVRDCFLKVSILYIGDFVHFARLFCQFYRNSSKLFKWVFCSFANWLQPSLHSFFYFSSIAVGGAFANISKDKKKSDENNILPVD